MDDQQLLRYGRHILLNEIGIEGQQRLLDAKALIIGLGGLGSPTAMYLAASGVGQLVLCDHDTVDFSNLQRQIIHRTASVGQPKVASAQAALRDINPEVECVALQLRADAAQLRDLAARVDVVVDCSDNFMTRYAVNRVCLEMRKPLVSGAAIQFDGQVAVFDYRRADAPCYNCLFPEDSLAAELRCATTGVFAPLVGIVGSLQAAETLKVLMGIERGLSGKLLTINALDMQIMRSALSKDPACRACGETAADNAHASDPHMAHCTSGDCPG
ncbi:MAG: molybdopterin biosynthesis protein MoeB [Gallionellales bacterium RIFCSPLOWO2_12_FULL_59_22]|nr:MAG: molybdopterin biosynthesis protein MoeB [Gallionellales bacterium RIFCSPLOWO2_02_FULL_59_110]OGT02237.1 MAG: molybdopterin biosynthesis protein MoeB [Gallionellales bacterium RIFCSPLOWO2_02_58_13]OGT14349.1 MAG: molybdopterin biosynthesis protein MoeB [Gallionellales bacterium RIFCSPLOWO2_12_FULL_59_22]